MKLLIIWIIRIVSLLCSIGSGYSLYISFRRLEDIALIAFIFCFSLSMAILYVSVFRTDVFYSKDE
jgi:hypothetical protein